MRPVVNGLEQTYGDRIDFRSYNIASEEGQTWARQYNLPGHPAYVLLDGQGVARWQGAGVLPKATIEAELLAVLP